MKKKSFSVAYKREFYSKALLITDKNGFVAATKLGTTYKFFVAALQPKILLQ